MTIAILQFPGSNCDFDALHAFRTVLGVDARLVFHKDTSLGDASAVIVPGGFSYGDYLRCGAIARFSPIMKAVMAFAANGGPVLGICNGFQILCEAGLLPGALIRNDVLEFRCQMCDLAVEDCTPAFSKATLGQSLRIPIAHGEGNFRADPDVLERIEKNGQVLVRYTDPTGNPNGSLNDIAGIRNERGNVFGLMPHPERAVEPIHQSLDGLPFLKAFLKSAESARA